MDKEVSSRLANIGVRLTFLAKSIHLLNVMCINHQADLAAMAAVVDDLIKNPDGAAPKGVRHGET